MILLDTNVLSALMRVEPVQAVVDWLDRQPPESIWITSITVFDARFALTLLRQGKRRTTLETAFGRVMEEDLDNRVLPFHAAAAGDAATLAVKRRQGGHRRRISAHCQIDGLRRSHG